MRKSLLITLYALTSILQIDAMDAAKRREKIESLKQELDALEKAETIETTKKIVSQNNLNYQTKKHQEFQTLYPPKIASFLASMSKKYAQKKESMPAYNIDSTCAPFPYNDDEAFDSNCYLGTIFPIIQKSMTVSYIRFARTKEDKDGFDQINKPIHDFGSSNSRYFEGITIGYDNCLETIFPNLKSEHYRNCSGSRMDSAKNRRIAMLNAKENVFFDNELKRLEQHRNHIISEHNKINEAINTQINDTIKEEWSKMFFLQKIFNYWSFEENVRKDHRNKNSQQHQDLDTYQVAFESINHEIESFTNPYNRDGFSKACIYDDINKKPSPISLESKNGKLFVKTLRINKPRDNEDFKLLKMARQQYDPSKE